MRKIYNSTFMSFITKACCVIQGLFASILFILDASKW